MIDINIVLHEPEIPQNTGNIARTCAATGASLHIIKPMGFTIDDNKLKRAGLDYWDKLNITYYENLEDFFQKNQEGAIYYYTTKAPVAYTEVQEYPQKVYIMFGKESKGLPEHYINLLGIFFHLCISHGRFGRIIINSAVPVPLEKIL